MPWDGNCCRGDSVSCCARYGAFYWEQGRWACTGEALVEGPHSWDQLQTIWQHLVSSLLTCTWTVCTNLHIIFLFQPFGKSVSGLTGVVLVFTVILSDCIKRGWGKPSLMHGCDFCPTTSPHFCRQAWKQMFKISYYKISSVSRHWNRQWNSY